MAMRWTYEEKFLEPARAVLTVFYFFKSVLSISLVCLSMFNQTQINNSASERA